MAFYSPDAAMDQRLRALLQAVEADAGASMTAGLSITWLRYGRSLLPDGPLPASGLSSAQSTDLSAADLSAAGLDARRLQDAAPADVRLPDGSPPQGRPVDPAAEAFRDASTAPQRQIPGRGACWRGMERRDPGELVQLVYLIAAERWLQRGLLRQEPELSRALRAMASQGSHEATSYVVDRLSGTTSGPALAPHARAAWAAQRLLVNGWLASLGWPELEGCRAAQKTWQDGPYGRERDFLGDSGENADRFSSDGLARLLEAVLAGTLISPPACRRMRELLAEPPAGADQAPTPRSRLSSLLGSDPPAGLRFWGKGGRSAAGVQLAVYGEGEKRLPFLLVILVERAYAGDTVGLLDRVVRELSRADPLEG